MKYSFIVPIYNDGFMASDFSDEFERVFKFFLGKEKISENVELIFVNDGSSDGSINHLLNLIRRHNFVKIIDLSRNFGQHIALSCGYKHANGDLVGMLNVDMQDPPSEIPILINYLIEGKFDIVFGLVEKRKASFANRMTSHFFNVLLNYLTQSNTPLNVATIRIMNRKFVNAYNQLEEKTRYLPGLENWLGFKHGYVEVKHQDRKIGKSSYNFSKRLKMAIESIISFSDYPLVITVKLGICIAIIGFILVILLLISKLFFVDYQKGYISIISIIIFLGGLQISVIGFASLYIGRILKESQGRPLYVINEKYNF
ncbi:MAG: glycosyltransferase family 2 protein [Bacteroidia bacterium]|jgi:glycosyltransferase involved in cell wall biosynthesis